MVGAFLGTRVPSQVIAICCVREDALVFEVQSGGRLTTATKDALLVTSFQPLKIVGFVEHGLDAKWYLDPCPLLLALVSWSFEFMGVLP